MVVRCYRAGEHTTLTRGIVCLLTALVSWSAHAESPRIALRGGVVWHHVSGEFSSTKDGRPPIKLDLNDVGLNGDDIDRFLGASVRVGKRWTLRLDHFGYSRGGNRNAEFEFNFDDLDVPVGAVVNAEAKLWLYVANLGYRLIETDHWDWSVGAGVHVTQLDYELDARITTGAEEFPLGEEESQYWLPLPNLYTATNFKVSDRWTLHAGGGWFSLHYDDYDGRLLFGRVAAEYRVGRHFGVGLGYAILDVDVDRDRGKKVETYRVTMPGPGIYVVAQF